MFWHFFGVYGVLVLSTLTGLGIVISERVERSELQQVEDSLRSQAILIQEALRGAIGPNENELNERLKALKKDLDTRITLILPNGRVLADTDEDPRKMENHGHRPEIVEAREHRFGSAQRYSTTISQSMMYLAMKAGDNNWNVAYVRLALPLVEVETKVASLRWLVWSATGLAALLSMAVAFWLTRRMTRPLHQLTLGAERIAGGSYGHRVPVKGTDEVGQLARSFNNMSERLAAQFAQLDEDRQQLRAVLSSMVEGVIALDQEQCVLFANERAGELLEFDTRSAVGRHLWELVRIKPLQEIVYKAFAQTELPRPELNVNGVVPRSLAVHVGRFPGRPPRGLVLVFHDTSDLRRLERLRQEFVANVSHELKTPLSVITACVETLIDGAMDDPENRGRFLERIAEQADRLHNLILDLLSLARIESETETFSIQPVALDKVVRACLEKHHTLAASKHMQLEAVPAADASSAHALADEEAVRQILDNLVDNALKYTPDGGTVRVRWGREDGQVFLQVEDTGIGIPEAELPRIFERFYRVDKARSRALGGTGLGLSIVKHLVQAMQGSVGATSRVGTGSTFLVRLPAAENGAASSQNLHIETLQSPQL
jgi:two-component system phosphate regulon sensor histidine kinase PhoR